MANHFPYRIHGLNILSQQPLKKEQDTFASADIVIQWISQLPQLPACAESHILRNQANESQAILCKYNNGYLSVNYFDCGFFYLQNSTLSVFQKHPDNDFFMAMLTTQILPLLSSLYRVTLHGGVVVQEGRAAIYLGSEGVGKSTLATYLWQNGFHIYSDDVAAIEIDSSVRVHPGLPEIRVNRDSCENLLSEAQGQLLPVKLAKQQILFSQNEFAMASVVAIFILSPQKKSSSLQKSALSAAQCFLPLIKNQFRWDIWNPKIVRNEFEVLASLCQHVPCWQLEYPLDYASLPWVRQQIEGSLHAPKENAAGFRQLL